MAMLNNQRVFNFHFLWLPESIHSKTAWSYPAEKPAETRWGKVDSCMPAFMVAGLFEAKKGTWWFNMV